MVFILLFHFFGLGFILCGRLRPSREYSVVLAGLFCSSSFVGGSGSLLPFAGGLGSSETVSGVSFTVLCGSIYGSPLQSRLLGFVSDSSF
jgi:hypothetical protein